MMKMQAKILLTCSLAATVAVAPAQYMAESSAAINMSNTMNGVPGGPAPVPGMVPGPGNPGVGFAPNAMGGNTMPGMNPSMDPAVMGDPTLTGMPGGYAGGVAATFTPAATPIPTENVMIGRRVYDAVSGGLLEDAVEIAVRQSDLASYPDDGVNDNGIAGDGIHGKVETVNGQYIGAFSNTVKNHLVHAVRNAEQIDPMIYYGYHVAKVDPRLEGQKRYGLPLPGEQEALLASTPVPDMPNVLQLEDDRDELVRQWNQDFLAEYRVTPEDPQSEYLPVYVPSPPLTPPNYPMPNGYVARQAVAKRTKSDLDVKDAESARQASQNRGNRGADGGAGAGGGPAI